MTSSKETEIQLMKLQNEWLVTKKIAPYQQMFSILVEYARSMILKLTRKKKFLSPDYVFSKAVEATISFIDQYEKTPDYRIDFSFGGVLRYKVLEALYSKKNRKGDDVLSLNQEYTTGNTPKEIEEYQETLKFTPLSGGIIAQEPIFNLYSSEKETIQIVLTVIIDLKKQIEDPSTIIDLLVGFLLFFRKYKYMESYKKTFFKNEKIRDIFEFSLLEIRNRLAEEA